MMNTATASSGSPREHYPHTSRAFGPVPLTDAAIERVAEQIRNSRGSGYFEIDLKTQVARVLVYEGTLHSGYVEVPDGVKRFPLSVLFARLRGKPDATISFFECPTPMLLLLAVCLQNPPAMRLQVAATDVTRFFDQLAAEGENVVAHIRRPPHHGLVYCRDGHPRAGFFSEPVRGKTVTEQMLDFVSRDPASTTLEVIKQLDSRCDVHGEVPIDELWRGRIGPPACFIEITRAGAVVARRVFEAVEVTIGRDLRNDLVLEFPSISRQHCKVSWNSGAFYLSDLDSGSGTALRGQRISREKLEYGDVFRIGDCDVRFSRDATGEATKHELQTLFLDAPRPGSGPTPSLVVDGRLHPITKPVFTLGGGAGADVRIRGWFVRGIQATIIAATNPLRIIPTAGGRAVRVNRAALPKEGLPLTHGDSIEVAGTLITFVESETQ